MTTKVIIVVVEGDSDRALISDRLEEYFDSYDVNFAIAKSDVFLMSKETTIKTNINKHIDALIRKKKFFYTDIACVVHITDTDGCFIGDELILIDENQIKNTIYNEENILVKSESQKSHIIGRNKAKRNNTNLMLPLSTIKIKRKEVKYQVFYFARHLEHVLFNNPNPPKKAKVSEVDDFLDELTVKLDEWLKRYMKEFSSSDYSGKYIEKRYECSANI